MFNKYPYSDYHEINLDWIISKVNDLETRISNIKTEFIAEANAYTDEKVQGFQAQIDEVRAELERTVQEVEYTFERMSNDLRQENAVFQSNINARMALLSNEVRNIANKIDAEIIGANEYTRYAIEQNNAYILNEIGKFLRQVTVINYITGQEMSIQEMFDYLITEFHLEDALTNTEVTQKSKTCAEINAINASCQTWNIRSGILLQ